MTNEINHEDARIAFEYAKNNRERRAEKPFVEASKLEKAIKAGIYTVAAAGAIASATGLGSMMTAAYHHFIDVPKIEKSQRSSDQKEIVLELESYNRQVKLSKQMAPGRGQKDIWTFYDKTKDPKSKEEIKAYAKSYTYLMDSSHDLEYQLQDSDSVVNPEYKVKEYAQEMIEWLTAYKNMVGFGFRYYYGEEKDSLEPGGGIDPETYCKKGCHWYRYYGLDPEEGFGPEEYEKIRQERLSEIDGVTQYFKNLKDRGKPKDGE